MLGAEEKRWLVVGICLSKVLTPVLRKVIEQEMKQLYQILIQPPTNIHAQTLSSHQKCLSPSPLPLNYANINNNAAQTSHHSYDYSVKDEVSLAKLFVKPFMASFTAFDESLDLSAALSILCGAPNFVFDGVDFFALNVRAEVRNEWGHCKFDTWTEAYYNKCFHHMENLVQKLDLRFLPVAFVIKVFQDLKEWQNRGIDMCFEHPIKNDVLKMVQDEMSTLMTSVEDNKETWKQDHEGLRNNLQNLTQSLEAKHTSLRTGFERLESQQQILEEKVSRLSQGMDTGNDFLKTGLLWKVPLAVILALLLRILLYEINIQEFLLGYWYSQQGSLSKVTSGVLVVLLVFFLYEHYTKGSTLRYWYSRRGSIRGGRSLSFGYTTYNHQTPTVNGIEFSWGNLKRKMNLTFDPLDLPGVHYYLNTDRYAYGGIIPVRSLLDNTPQVLGAEVFAVNSECTQIFFEEDGTWKPYRSARNIHCTNLGNKMVKKEL